MPKMPLVQFVHEARQEFSRVVWPTRKETITTAMMVLILTVIAALFFLLADIVMSRTVDFFLGLGA